MNEEVENTNEKKKQIRLVIIGIVALLLLTLGATFAYFLIDTDNSTSKSNIKGDISKAGVATLVPGTSNLHINLKAEDMAEAKQGTEYYGDELESNPYVLSEEEGTHTISQVQITDGEDTTKYSCNAKVVVTMEIAEDNNMGSVLEPGDLILQFKGNLINEQLDLSEIKESGTKEYNLKFKLTGNTTEDIEAYIKLINRKENQNYLASKNLKVDINTTELSCDIAGPDPKIEYLKEKTDCLTDELVNGLYRCQGNSIVKKVNTYNDDGHIGIRSIDREDTVNNNYICLGNDCSSEKSADMYRILGINEDGEIKVIKNTPSSLFITWHNSNTDTQWPDSNMFSYLNNDFYQTLPIELKEKIVNATWNYGKIIDPRNANNSIQNIFTQEELAKYNEFNDAIDGTELNDAQKREKVKELSKMFSEALMKRENELIDNVQANIGLMNLIDYCSSFESNSVYNCMTSEYYDKFDEVNNNENYGLTWLTIGFENGGSELLLSHLGFVRYDYRTWSVKAAGFVDSYQLMTTPSQTRPVFFLTSDIELSGEGTIASPFRVAGIE